MENLICGLNSPHWVRSLRSTWCGGDNAIVVGMAAAGVPVEQRRKVIFWGVGAAIVLRIFFALITTQLLAIIGLTLAGGVRCCGSAGRCSASCARMARMRWRLTRRSKRDRPTPRTPDARRRDLADRGG